MPSAYPERPVVSVAAIAIKDKKILLAKRAAPPGQGLWSMPGGVVELGETLKDALKREFKEETGLECEVKKLFDVYEVIIKDENGKIVYHYVILDYLVDVKGGVLSPASDALDAKWVTRDEALKLQLTSTTRKLIKRLIDEGFL